ncbi:hypothetical protein [Microcoleus sp. CAWBG640]|uniref:hypothetical protein n=1 Tax=Microcoleus sp. CAWBG640 TaxID=2841653 RepID=UPI00312B4B64
MRSTIIQGPIGPIHIQEASPSVTSGESEALPDRPYKTPQLKIDCQTLNFCGGNLQFKDLYFTIGPCK